MTTVIDCYILFAKGTLHYAQMRRKGIAIFMKIIINNTSMQPIYEQLVEQIKHQIVTKELVEGAPLPSVRVLAKELKISALTVKKAYDFLEEEGLIATVHGKGSFILGVNPDLMEEECRKEVEACMEQAIRKGRSGGMSDAQLREVLELLLESE